MRPHAPAPIDRESGFSIHELFFSTTDRAGVIRAGNDVFVRVSGYRCEDLIGAPHNIIRHPHMPRAAFWLLWDYLLAGKAVAAYVKNMSADGAYYWVLAVVAPIAGGYLSIRLKPSTSAKDRFEALYAQLHQIESRGTGSPDLRAKALEESRAALFAAVKQLGHDSYDGLMQEILLGEVRSRKQLLSAARNDASRRQGGWVADAAPGPLQRHCRSLARQVRELLDSLESFLSLEGEMAENVTFIRNLCGGLHRLSIDAQVQAARLGSEGGALKVIAAQMKDCARAITESALEICDRMSKVMPVLKGAAAQIATTDLSVEMMTDFLAEPEGISRGARDERRARPEIGQLAEVVSNNLDGTLERVRAATDHVNDLERRLERFVGEIRTLEMLRVSGKGEAIHCRNASAVSSVFEEVFARTRVARDKLLFLVGLVSRARIKPPDAETIRAGIAALRAA